MVERVACMLCDRLVGLYGCGGKFGKKSSTIGVSVQSGMSIEVKSIAIPDGHYRRMEDVVQCYHLAETSE